MMLPREIGRLMALRVLFASRNFLTTLPAKVGQLTVLEQLFADHNKLTTLPPELSHISSLLCAVFHDNPQLNRETVPARFWLTS